MRSTKPRSHSRLRRPAALAAATVALTLVCAAQASAANAPVSSSSDDVAALIAEVAPQIGPIAAAVEQSDGSYDAKAGGTTVELPVAGDGTIEVDGIGLSVTLPDVDASSADAAVDGTVVYSAGDAGVTTAVQADSSGIRIQSVLGSADAADELRYGIDGATPVLRADGGADLVRPGVGPSPVDTIVGFVEAPWAFDGEGDAVSTHYVVEGDGLVQVVQTTADTAYPVVADPRLSWGVGAYISFNQLEMQTLGMALASIGYAGGYYACSVWGTKLAKVPGAATMMKYICGSFSASAAMAFAKSLPSLTASWYTASCYQTRIPTQTPAWKVVDSSQCVSRADSFNWW